MSLKHSLETTFVRLGLAFHLDQAGKNLTRLDLVVHDKELPVSLIGQQEDNEERIS
jgi:hypothetical protein